MQGEEEGDEAAEDDVGDPFDRDCDTGHVLIVFYAFFGILEAVRDVKHLIYVV